MGRHLGLCRFCCMVARRPGGVFRKSCFQLYQAALPPVVRVLSIALLPLSTPDRHEEHQPDAQQRPRGRLGNLHQREGGIRESISSRVKERNRF